MRGSKGQKIRLEEYRPLATAEVGIEADEDSDLELNPYFAKYIRTPEETSPHIIYQQNKSRCCSTTTIIVTSIVTFILLLLVILSVMHKPVKPEFSSWLVDPDIGGDPSDPLILAWTKFSDENLAEHLFNGRGDACLSKCRFSSNRTLFPDATAVVFHIHDMHLDDLPDQKKGQVFVAYNTRPPRPEDDGGFGQIPIGFFNTDMDYRPNSGHSSSPTWSSYIEEEHNNTEEIKKAMAKKNGGDPIAYYLKGEEKTSDSRREDYIKELSQQINLTIIPEASCDETCLTSLKESHLFVLALEASVCNYSASPRFWDLKDFVVPIVLNRDTHSLLTPVASAFIAADDFNNVTELAEHLLDLRENKDKYKEHFEWRRRYSVSSRLVGLGCDLCRGLSQSRKSDTPETITDFTKRFSYADNCKANYASGLLNDVMPISIIPSLVLLLTVHIATFCL